jgi:hypothetical protein
MYWPIRKIFFPPKRRPPKDKFNPLRIRECPTCGHVGRPHYSRAYLVILAAIAAIFGPLAWFLPWWPGLLKVWPIFLWGYGTYELALDKNACRCAKCGGISW